VEEPQQSIEFETASREDLIGFILELRQIISDQQQIIAEQAKRIAELEDHLGLGGGSGSPLVSIKSSRKKACDSKNKRKPRHLQFSRKREAPTRIVDHRAQRCPDCGRPVSNGSPKRSRQVIDFVPAPVEIASMSSSHIHKTRNPCDSFLRFGWFLLTLCALVLSFALTTPTHAQTSKPDIQTPLDDRVNEVGEEARDAAIQFSLDRLGQESSYPVVGTAAEYWPLVPLTGKVDDLMTNQTYRFAIPL